MRALSIYKVKYILNKYNYIYEKNYKCKEREKSLKIQKKRFTTWKRGPNRTLKTYTYIYIYLNNISNILYNINYKRKIQQSQRGILCGCKNGYR